MFKPFNNKKLSIVLVVLLALYGLTLFFNSGKKQRNFRSELVSVDTAAISSILIYPKSEGGEEIRLTKTGTSWITEKEDIKADADSRSMENLISSLLSIKPQRLAAKSSEKWEQYQLTDSLATRVKVFEGSEQTLDLMVGKISFQQRPPSPQQSRFQQQPNISGTSFVRLADEEEVYAVEGFLSMTFDQGFNSWRNKQFAKATQTDLTRLNFIYPADSGFVLMLRDTVWTIGESLADSAATVNYLRTVSNLTSSTFADDFQLPGAPTHQLSLEGNNMSAVMLQGYAGPGEGEYYLNSSQNPEAWFRDESLFNRVFVSGGTFLKEE